MMQAFLQGLTMPDLITMTMGGARASSIPLCLLSSPCPVPSSSHLSGAVSDASVARIAASVKQQFGDRAAIEQGVEEFIAYLSRAGDSVSITVRVPVRGSIEERQEKGR
jgi:hypothetical protein